MTTNRSPNYPSQSLGDAIELARRLHDKEKRSPADPAQVVRAWGYSGLSGPSRVKLSTLRKYGLLEETGKGLRLTDRAMAILFPHDKAEEAQALRDAAHEPDLFQELASYDGASDDNLASRLVRGGFTQAGARAAIASFRETMAIVPSKTTDYNASHEQEPSAPARDLPPSRGVAQVTIATPSQVPAAENPAGIVFNIGLPGGARVDLRVSGGPLTKDGLVLLRDYLAIIERNISATEAASPREVSPAADPTEPEQHDERSLIVRPA